MEKANTQAALHLGMLHELRMGENAQVDMHIGKADSMWYAYKHFWFDQDTPRDWRLLVFHSVILYPLLDGLETVCMPTSVIAHLQGRIMKRLRSIMGTSARGKN